jgi:hypothetical protein
MSAAIVTMGVLDHHRHRGYRGAEVGTNVDCSQSCFGK